MLRRMSADVAGDISRYAIATVEGSPLFIEHGIVGTALKRHEEGQGQHLKRDESGP